MADICFDWWCAGQPEGHHPEAIAQNQPMSTPEYAVYPKPLKTEFDARRFAIGEDIYRVLGITREDKAGRRAQFAKNALMFNAPVGVFAYIDRSLSYGQWMDLGMFLQSLMLLCEDHGLASCAQGYWTFFHDNVRAATGAPDDLMLACGLALALKILMPRSTGCIRRGQQLMNLPPSLIKRMIGWVLIGAMIDISYAAGPNRWRRAGEAR